MASVIPPGGGELIGDSADRRVEVLSEAESLHATWSRFGPHRDGAGLHVHRHHTDLFYVLDGELTIRLGRDDRQVALAAGDLVTVPPLVIHGFRNAGDVDVRYLNLHAPGCGFIAYMRGIRDDTGESFDQHDPPAAGERSAADASFGTSAVEVEEPGRRVELLTTVETIAVRRASLDAGAASGSAAGWAFVLGGAIELSGIADELGAGTWVALDGDAYRAGPGGALVLELTAPGG